MVYLQCVSSCRSPLFIGDIKQWRPALSLASRDYPLHSNSKRGYKHCKVCSSWAWTVKKKNRSSNCRKVPPLFKNLPPVSVRPSFLPPSLSYSEAIALFAGPPPLPRPSPQPPFLGTLCSLLQLIIIPWSRKCISSHPPPYRWQKRARRLQSHHAKLSSKI